jgi:hypothetical protein
VYVREDDEYETGIVLQNWYRYRRNPGEYLAEAQIELLNHIGDRRVADTPAIPACTSVYIRLADLFPDVRAFMGGRIGGLKIHSNIAMGRSIPVVRSRRTGFAAVSHTVGDHDPAIYTRELVSSTTQGDAWGPVWTSFVEESDSIHTDFSIFNNWLPRNVYDIDVRLFDSMGVLRGKGIRAIRVHADQTKLVSMSRLLGELGMSGPFRGIIEARLSPRLDQAEMPGPGMFQVNTVWTFGSALSQSNNQSLGHVNTASAVPHYLSPKRTKMFGRVVSNERYDTVLSLLNPSSDEHYTRMSETDITVFDASGTRQQSKRVVLPPHGSLWVSLDELFPNLPDFLSESAGVSSLVVIDKTLKLTGYLGVRDRVRGTMGVDHLFGG